MNKNGLQKPATTTKSGLVFWGMTGILMAVGGMSAPAAFAQSKTTKTKAAAVKVVSATTVSATTPVVPAVATDKSARVTVLDKQTNRRQVVVLVASEAQTVGTVQVKLLKCLPDHDGILGQDVAWLDITDGSDSGRSAPWFSGWMFNTYPEVSTLDHPRYDVQLQGCGTKARQLIKATGSAPVIENTAPVVDTETPNDVPAATEGDSGADTTAPASTDPYVVPGVQDESKPVAPVAPPVQPTAPVEEPAAEQPVQGEQGDLHRMMDSGQY